MWHALWSPWRACFVRHLPSLSISTLLYLKLPIHVRDISRCDARTQTHKTHIHTIQSPYRSVPELITHYYDYVKQRQMVMPRTLRIAHALYKQMDI